MLELSSRVPEVAKLLEWQAKGTVGRVVLLAEFFFKKKISAL